MSRCTEFTLDGGDFPGALERAIQHYGAAAMPPLDLTTVGCARSVASNRLHVRWYAANPPQPGQSHSARHHRHLIGEELERMVGEELLAVNLVAWCIYEECAICQPKACPKCGGTIQPGAPC